MKKMKVEFFLELNDDTKFDKEEYDYLTAAINHHIEEILDLDSWPSIASVYAAKYTVYDKDDNEISEEDGKLIK